MGQRKAVTLKKAVAYRKATSADKGDCLGGGTCWVLPGRRWLGMGVEQVSLAHVEYENRHRASCRETFWSRWTLRARGSVLFGWV